MSSVTPLRHLVYKVFRTKTVTDEFMDTSLSRCLSTFDIAVLGIGQMMGAGVYVMTGEVARDIAGPGVVISFLLAGIASLLAALSYAEFGARVPKAGSAYTYTYVSMGEIWAFIIGWNIILEHMLSAAAVGRSWSGYLDSMLGHVIRNGTVHYIGTMEGPLMDYPDFIAFLIVIAISVFIGCGAKISATFNTVFTAVNVVVIAFVIIYGFTFADGANWTQHGGFLPYKFTGVLSGAASCFFAYVGFDGIATSGEEAKNPGKSIPVATMIAMTTVTISYVFMSSALTLMVPYTDIHATSAFADAFEQRGAVWAKYIVAIGALSGITTSLVGSMFCLPRCVYAMASDGLIFQSFAYVHSKTQVPILAVAVFGVLAAIISLLFDIRTIVQFLSIGTLMAYTIVSCSVIILRYQPMISATEPTTAYEQVDAVHDVEGSDDTKAIVFEGEEGAGRLQNRYMFLKPLFAKYEPGTAVCASVFGMVIFMFCLGAVIHYGAANWYCVLFGIIFALGIAASFLTICVHEQSEGPKLFKVPFVPLVPTLSIFINVVLMMHLNSKTWIRLVIWLAVGLLVYFFYGVNHSRENTVLQKEISGLLRDGGKGPPENGATQKEDK